MTGCGEGGSAKELQLLSDENSVCGHVLLMENDHIFRKALIVEMKC